MNTHLSLRLAPAALGALLMAFVAVPSPAAPGSGGVEGAKALSAPGEGTSASNALKGPAQSPDVGLERSALLKTDMEFSRTSTIKGMAGAFVDYLADDAVLFPANAQLVSGKEAIRLHLAGNEGVVLSWKPIKAEVARSGDLGYTYGTYEMRGTGAEGQPRISYGKYVSVWRKQPDGTWKLALDIGNASAAPGGASPAP